MLECPHSTRPPARTVQIPKYCLEEILLEVVLQDGDQALLTLALVCSCFRDIVTDYNFSRAAHFLWLDSVTNWSNFSREYQREFRTMYSVMTCLQCHCLYKSCMPGYVGRGRRGELHGIYSEHSYPGFCSQFCQLRRHGAINTNTWTHCVPLPASLTHRHSAYSVLPHQIVQLSKNLQEVVAVNIGYNGQP
ncbi:hypothetical protein SKAU_G00171500 [Synaphobranchus kaupii]|uniref:CxC7-like cysteine cluster associated with KDZ transposases domain-containing protein n=1 Tax=Synaphobranchus kaupii TaxID=118154 RepID=A0A9Q1FKG9_SYNKA|nr:hypothetical protein SKAU_G00171500 [Synaphobranchus kaupii]